MWGKFIISDQSSIPIQLLQTKIVAVENFAVSWFDVLREYFAIFIFAVRGNCENFITVQFNYLGIKIELAADNEMEGHEKLHTISDGLKVLQDGHAGRLPRVFTEILQKHFPKLTR